jgi:hypothetical protein
MPEDQGPRTRLKWRVSVVYRIISNARGPGTKDQTEVEIRWRVCAVYHIISNARGPKTRLKWIVSVVYSII